ncbi:MAG: prepilin-type N-terminal cleavage/methylation protein [Planctomycetaceae bacterium]|nr:prepilin-type N-terminal cleavage/methylation protein [Planctomycetaceae bacterium]
MKTICRQLDHRQIGPPAPESPAAHVPGLPNCRRGISLVELLVCVTLIGIMTSMAVPSFRRAVDQSRADIATANLRAIWSAERCYWLEYRCYTSDLNLLRSLGLLDPTIVTSSSFYAYDIPSAETTAFTATATRIGGTRWTGAFTIDETGVVSGSVNASGEPTIVPGYQ